MKKLNSFVTKRFLLALMAGLFVMCIEPHTERRIAEQEIKSTLKSAEADVEIVIPFIHLPKA